MHLYVIKANFMKLQILFIATAFLTLSACSTARQAQKENSVMDQPLYGTKWSLKKINESGNSQSVETKAFIRFDEMKKSAGGNGSCNSFGSSLTIEDNNLRFSNIFSTKMYCEAVQSTENSYLSLLAKVDRFKITGEVLSLYFSDVVILEFSAEDISAL